jgi:hypothetical protein
LSSFDARCRNPHLIEIFMGSFADVEVMRFKGCRAQKYHMLEAVTETSKYGILLLHGDET